MAGTNVTLPQAGDEVTAAWGQEVAKGLNGIQSGTATTPTGTGEVSGTIAVTFPKPYAVAPIIIAMGFNVHWYIAGTATATVATFQSKRLGQSTGAGTSFHWIAVGTLA